MIVKNEEKLLEICLNSIKDLVDEIIIVDTGSTDNSKEIARKFTDKIFDFKWNDNFSDARNFSLSKATKEWILSLDADEVIAEKDCIAIKNLIEKNKAEGYLFDWRNYTNDIGVAGFISSKDDQYEESKRANGFYVSKILRFFKNNENHRFFGRIHETVHDSIKKAGGKIFDTSIVIHHFGNLEKEKYFQKKSKYIDLLKKRIEDKDFVEKTEDYVCCELAGELMNNNEYDEAIKYLERAVKINEEYKYLFILGTAYLIKKKYESAERAYLRAIIIDSNNPSVFNDRNPAIYNNLGIIYSINKNYEKAIKKLEKAIALSPKYADAYFNLGLVYKKMNKNEKAEEFFNKAILLNPNYKNKIDNIENE